MTRERRTTLRVVLAVACLALAAIQAPATALELVRVATPATDDIGNATLFAAEDLGYFTANGLKVEVTKYRGAGAGQEALAAGAADVAVAPVPAVATAVSKGVREKIVAVGVIVSNTGWRIMSLNSSPIRTPADLAGKKVGITSKNSITDYYVLWLERKHGIKIQSIPIGGGGVAALKAGQIDAYVMSPILSYRMALEGGMRTIVDLGEEKDLYLPATFAAATEFLEKKPEAIKGFVDALFKATRYMQDNEEYSLKVLKQFTGPEDAAVLPELHRNVVRSLSKDGKADRAALESAVRLLTLVGVKQSDIPSIDTFVAPQVYATR
jgi:NitT/TauT family transport system substrate-binding protein